MERSRDDLLFVYGLLRIGAPHAMARFLEQNAKHICTARMRGAMYLVSYYPGIVIQEDKGWVIGDIFRIEDMDLWSKLDKFEGIPEHDEYRLVKADAVTQNEIFECFTYEYNKSTVNMNVILSGDFLKHIKHSDKGVRR